MEIASGGRNGQSTFEIRRAMRLTNLVENVKCRHVDSTSLDNIDKLIQRSIATDVDVCVRDLVLRQHCFDFLRLDVRKGDGVRNGDSSSIFLSDGDGWRSLVESNSESFQFCFDNLAANMREYDDQAKYRIDEQLCLLAVSVHPAR